MKFARMQSRIRTSALRACSSSVGRMSTVAQNTIRVTFVDREVSERGLRGPRPQRCSSRADLFSFLLFFTRTGQPRNGARFDRTDGIGGGQEAQGRPGGAVRRRGIADGG